MLAGVVRAAETALIDAELGGGLIKQRVARAGQGKSGGYRTIIAYRRGDRAVFLFGFAKSERDNIEDSELAEWRLVGRRYLGLGTTELDSAVAADELIEVDYDDDD